MGACSRLCDLITASLLPYIESKPASFSKEDERNLLSALSQVSREIERWTNEIDARSEGQEIIVKQLPDSEHNCFQHLEQSSRGYYNCLANIVSALVAFVSYDSRFVQHISGNILVSVSSFLARYGSNLVKFLHLLWISLEVLVSSICIYGSSTSLVEYAFLVDQSLMPCSQHITDEISVADEPICDHTSFIALLQRRLVNTHSLMVAGLFQILRRILKYVKQGSGVIKEKINLLTLSSLLRMPWNEFSTSQMLTSEENSGTKGLLEEKTCLERHSKVLLGSVIQLFCSVVEHKDQDDVGGLKEFSVYFKFTNLVPKLICCFSKQLGSTEQHISGYFRHKVLMLMIRLSYYDNWESSCPVSWLKLLKQYFEDLLYERISEHDATFGNSLDGSPFLPSFTSGNKVHYRCNRNLQRQAIFLLFKCCFTLFRVSKDTCKRCDCAVESWPSACLVQLCGEDCCHRGLSELFQWLQRSDLLEKIVDYEDFFKLCGSFALSFLQLYAEDDAMLLEMLLQLLDAPSFTFHVQNTKKDRPLDELKKDMCFLFSSIFNPIHLFHMFLLVLHYDHSVLIDYLISKDTGIPCVKYLLRCLRIICESWPTFMNFSICGTETNQSCYKRRKITRNKDCSRKSSPFRSSTAMVRRQHSGRHKGCRMSKGVNIPTFINAKECLLCLQKSVEEIHKKKLFPYNPKPLLGRLSRFPRSADLRFLFTAPYLPQPPSPPPSIPSFNPATARAFSAAHGLGVRAIALRVSSADAAFHESVAHGARPAHPPADLGEGFVLAEVELYGDVVLRYISHPDDTTTFLPGFQNLPQPDTEFSFGIRRLDHAVGNVPDLASAVAYVAVFTGFHPFAEFTSDDVGTAESGLNSVVLANNDETVLIPMNEPVHGTARRSQIQTYLDHNGGAGVQHLALASGDVFQTLREMRRRSAEGGFDFMPAPPPTYYKNLGRRVGDVLTVEQIRECEELGLLVDRDDQGVLLQIFTKPVGDRPTIFLEIIQRIGCMAKDDKGRDYQKGGCGGFGKGNFSELFKSIEEYEKTLEAK